MASKLLTKPRVLDIGTQRLSKVVCLDAPVHGGACHTYRIEPAGTLYDFDRSYVHFQEGPIKEAQPNGCFNEDLIAIVIDRLRGFQSGEFACRENALALTKLEEAMHWLNHRTVERQKAGVEGTGKKRPGEGA